MKGNHFKKAVPLICQMEFPPSRETANFYMEAMEQIPARYWQRTPLLYVIRCLYLCTLFRYREAHLLLEQFCQKYDKADNIPEHLRVVLGEAYIVCGYTAMCLPVSETRILELLQRAVQLLPGGSNIYPAMLNAYSSSPVLRLKSPQAGSLKRYLECIKQIEVYYPKLHTKGTQAGSSALCLAEYHFLIHNFKEAYRNTSKAIQEGLAHKQYDFVCSACFLRARLYAAKGNYLKTLESLNLLKQYASELSGVEFFYLPDLADSWLHIILGKTHKVANWITDESEHEKKVKPWYYGNDRVAKAYYLLKIEEYEELITYAEVIVEQFEKRGFQLLNLYLLAMMSVAYYALGQDQQALMTLEELYRWCAGNEIIMPLVELGQYMRPIINMYRCQGSRLIEKEWLDGIEKKCNSFRVYHNNLLRQYRQHERQAGSPLENLTVAEKNPCSW